MIRCTCGAELFSIESVCSVCIHPKPPRAIYVEDLRIKLANREEEILYWKEATEIANNENIELRAERDRLKAALKALEAVRSDLPEKVSEQWLYEGVRHWHRNCDWDEPRDGSPLDRGNGATVAKILNMIPRKALGDAS